MLDIGEREAAEHRGQQHLAPVFGGAGAVHDRLHGRARRRMHIHVRHERQGMPGGRRGRAVHGLEQRLARPHAGLVHVDMRIGAVAGECRRQQRQVARQVGVEVERDRNRQVRRFGPDAAQQLALAVVEALRHHRAVEVEEERVAALPDRLQHGVGDEVENVVRRGRARMRVRRNRHGERRTLALGDVDIGGERIVGAAIDAHGLFAPRGPVRRTDAPEGGNRGWHGREGVGLVAHQRRDEAFAAHGAPFCRKRSGMAKRRPAADTGRPPPDRTVAGGSPGLS